MTAIDITRLLDKPRKRYSGARLQQGRVLLDSDFNETAGLHATNAEQALVDLIGAQGSPDQGFRIDDPATNAPFRPNLAELPATSFQLGGVEAALRVVNIHGGRFFLGGRSLDLEAEESFPFQRGFLQLGPSDLPVILELQPGADENPVVSGDLIDPFRDLYFLHSWDQTVSAVEDEEIRETALGGADTSARVRRMHRVEVLGNLDDRTNIVAAAWETKIRLLEQDNGSFDRASGELLSNGRLSLAFQARAAQVDECGDCTPDPPQRFLGVANETLRIMLTSPTTYVWAFDNAAPLYRVKVTGLTGAAGTEVRVTMLTPPSDEAHWPLDGRVVEILPFAALLDGAKLPGPVHPHFRKVAAEVGAFTRVREAFDPNTRSFTIDTDVGLDAIKGLIAQWDPSHPDADTLNIDPGDGSDARFFYMRLWHQADRAADVELPARFADFGERLGTTDVVPVFHSPGRRGDFWIAALRPGTPERVVPFDLATNPAGVPPQGPRHFYAPLALVQGGKTAAAPNDPPKVTSYKDARAQIRPLTDQGCVTLTVGDGVTSIGEFSSIQDAIDALPEDGGRIAVRPGTYRERLHIVDAHDLIIEGCGEATVIETPDQSPVPIDVNAGEDAPPPALVVIDDSSRVTFTGFRLNVIEETGIFVQTASTVVLRALNIIAGLRLGPRFARGSGPSGASMIRVKDTDTVEIGSVTVEPSSRPTLDASDTQNVRIEQLTAVGVTATTFSPGQAMLRFLASSVISIRDTILSPFGQIGVFLAHAADSTSNGQPAAANVTDVEISGLSVVAGPHRSLATGVVVPTQPGVSIDHSDRVTLKDSSIIMDDSFSEHAAVVAGGTDIVVHGNRIEALSRCFDVPTPRSPSPSPGTCRDLRVLAWAGLQIRGNSSRVQVRENHIIGGVGHGITLGSVIWSADSGFRFEGAGRAQISVRADGARTATGLITGSFRDERGTFFFAQDEGPLIDVVLADNRIEQMFGNGISALSVLGLPDGSLIETRNLRIERNTIIGNLLRPSENVLTRSDFLPFPTSLRGAGLFLPVLPFGGIVLAAAIHADIRGNVILGNGSSNALPTNGIFILNGESIVIADNRIAGNGARATPTEPLRPGVRAGIAVMLAGTNDIHTASLITALLAAPEAVRSPESNDQTSTDIIGFHVDGSALAVINNNVVQPEGRALHVVATGPVRIEGNHLASQGNHGADVPAEQFAIGDVVYVQNLGAPWEQIDFTSVGSDTLTPGNVTSFLKTSPWFFVGQGGAVLFANNHVIYDWTVQRLPSRASRAPVSFFSVAILTTDHLSMDANQLGFRLRGLDSPAAITSPVTPFTEPVLGHVLTLGGTVQVSGNRIAEKVQSVTFSLVSFSQLMNLTSFNQMTHEMFALNYTKRMQSELDRTNALLEGTPRHADEPDLAPAAESIQGVFVANPPDGSEFHSETTNYYARRGNQVMFRANQFEQADAVPDDFTQKSIILPKFFFLTRSVGLFFELMRER